MGEPHGIGKLESRGFEWRKTRKGMRDVRGDGGRRRGARVKRGKRCRHSHGIETCMTRGGFTLRSGVCRSRGLFPTNASHTPALHFVPWNFALGTNVVELIKHECAIDVIN